MILRSLILSGAAVLLFAVLLRFLGKRTPNLHRLLWFEAVLLGLCVIPWTLNLPVYDAPAFEVSRAETRDDITPFTPLSDVNEKSYKNRAVDGENTSRETGFVPAISGENTENTSRAFFAFLRSQLVGRGDWILWGWLAGIVFLLSRRVFQFTRLQRRLHGLDGVTPELWRQIGRGVPARWCWTKNLGPALVFSWSGYRILFPKTLWDELSDSQRLGILKHELSHYRSGDVWLCELVRLLVILQWYNPFAWYAARRFDEATEWKCDDAACEGPKELIETLMSVHDSTESLGVHVPSFARISVLTRIDRLKEITNDTPEKFTMKKTMVALLSVALLLGGLVQIKLVAKQTAEDTMSRERERAEPQEQPEIEGRLRLAQSMIEIPDITTARLADLLDDLERDFQKLRVENHEYCQSLERRINETIIQVCDRILAINPDVSVDPSTNSVDRALGAKYGALVSIAYRNGYTDADNAALKELVEEYKKWDAPDRPGVKRQRQLAQSAVAGMKIWRLEKIEKPTLEQFEPVLGEVAEFLATETDPNSYMAVSLIFVAEKMQDAKTMSRERLLAVYDRLIEVFSSKNDESDRWVLSKLENMRAIHRLVGQKAESILFLGEPLVFYNSTANPETKSFLIACPSTCFGSPEIAESSRIAEEFGISSLFYVWFEETPSTPGKSSGLVEISGNHKTIQFRMAIPHKENTSANIRNTDLKWLQHITEAGGISCIAAPQFVLNKTDLKPVAEEFSRHEYRPWHKTFLLLGEDAVVLEFGTAETIRAKLTELYGKPDAAKTAAGNRRAEEFAKLPQPCSANMMKIVVAMHHYHDTYGSFPPAYTVDAQGNKLHSWRTLLLPFLDQQALYKNIRLDEPWNSEHNRQFASTIIPVYQCHEYVFSPDRGPLASYSVVVAPQTIFPENGKASHFRDIHDGTSNTIALVERATPIPWMQPDDISFDDAMKGIGVTPDGIGDVHDGGCNVVFADGSVRFFPKDADLKKLRAALTKSGGEMVDWNSEF